LFVLAEADIADEAGVVPDDLLSPKFENAVWNCSVGDEIQSVQGKVARIRHGWKLCLAVRCAVEPVVAKVLGSLDVETKSETADRTAFEAKPRTERMRGGIFSESVLVYMLEPIAQIENERPIQEEIYNILFCHHCRRHR